MASSSIFRPNDCRHFHYETVELGPVKVELQEFCGGESPSKRIVLRVGSNGQNWWATGKQAEKGNSIKLRVLRRTMAELSEFDVQLHRCVFDRRHSALDGN